MTREAITREIEAHGVVAIIRMKEPDRLRAVIDALAAGGLRAIEVTMTVPGAIDLIAQIAPTLPRDFLFGAGTVLDADTASRAIDAGARFIVSPVFRKAVIDACHRRGVPALPGCLTPTEILDAWDAGADIVKVFPATTLGPGYLKDVRAPLPQVKLMPTGGVTHRQRRRLDQGRRGRGGCRQRARRQPGHCRGAISSTRRERAAHRGQRPRGAEPLMLKVVTFGEIMLRLSPPGFERLLQSPELVATFGGGEANVAVSLALFGLDSWYVTRLPKNPIGDAAIRVLRAEGVRTDAIERGGDRLGVYFVESGASQRASVVVYDRARSAISEMEPATVNWPTLFSGAAWFHVTGITPALGPKAAACTAEALAAAKKAGARVSVDLNFRKKLWSEAAAQQTMRPLMAYVDLVIANEEDIQSVLGLAVEGADVTTGHLDVEAYRRVAERITRDLGPSMVAITLRESVSASDNGWSAVLWDGTAQQFHRSQRYDVRLVDRIGGGDSFAGGLIYGLVTGRSAADSLRFAVAASALKQSIPGDFNRVSVDEVDRLAAGDASGRVQR